MPEIKVRDMSRDPQLFRHCIPALPLSQMVTQFMWRFVWITFFVSTSLPSFRRSSENHIQICWYSSSVAAILI